MLTILKKLKYLLEIV